MKRLPVPSSKILPDAAWKATTAATVEDAEKMAFSFLTPGCTVSFGGSMTLEDTGMLTALRHDPGITLLDRAQAKTPEETKKIYHDALSSDFIL